MRASPSEAAARYLHLPLVVGRIRDDSLQVRRLVADPANDVFLSVDSAWEIGLKHALGRLPLSDPAERFVPRERERHGFASLPLEEEATLHLHRLPRLHKDPFDRMLVCQAIEHGLSLVTPDRLITQYPVRSVWREWSDPVCFLYGTLVAPRRGSMGFPLEPRVSSQEEPIAHWQG